MNLKTKLAIAEDFSKEQIEKEVHSYTYDYFEDVDFEPYDIEDEDDDDDGADCNKDNEDDDWWFWNGLIS